MVLMLDIKINEIYECIYKVMLSGGKGKFIYIYIYAENMCKC